MKSVRKSLLRDLIVRFSLLVFLLLVVLSGVWVFLLRVHLLQDGIPEAEVLSRLFQVSGFIFVVILVLLIVAVLFGFIFIVDIKQRFIEMIRQLSELKNAQFTSRAVISSNDEFTDIAEGVNQVIERLEREITIALFKITQDETHLREEQNLLEAEQKQIYEEKEKLEYVLSRITDGVILLNRSRKVVLLNKAAEEIVGFAQSDAIEKPLGEVIKFFEETREIQVDEYAPQTKANSLQNDAFLKKRVRLESPSATPKLVDLICVRLTLIHTQDLGYMIILHDLTEELEIEKKRTGLLSSFASELRQPVSIISHYFSLFNQQHAGILQDNNQYLDRMQSGIAHLSLVIRNLLTAVAIENGTVTIIPISIDLLSVIKDLITVVHPLILERGIALQYEEPKDFSAAVTGDPDRIHQVVLNLFLNAIYYTPSGGSISISLSQSEQDIILQVQDTGIGIPQGEMKNLFVEFYVGPNAKSLDGGVGLGLYVSKKLVELQKGKIWLDSVEGKGTVASVSLPKVK
jgi:PAS domain S-box-containing protein